MPRDQITCCLAHIIHDGSSAPPPSPSPIIWGRVREGGGPRPARGALSLPVALFPPVSPVSLESGIGDCSRRVHEYCGLRLWLTQFRQSLENFRRARRAAGNTNIDRNEALHWTSHSIAAFEHAIVDRTVTERDDNLRIRRLFVHVFQRSFRDEGVPDLVEN